MPRITELSSSRGRFLAYQTEFLDPATIPAGTIVSMVVEALGSKNMPLDDEDYRYPTFRIRMLKIWPETAYVRPPSRPYFYRYPYHPFYPYWWDPWY
jgi:outer membrane lipoprotein